MTSRDLIQQRSTLPNGDTIWQNSPLVTAALEGKMAVLDGIHRIHPSTLATIYRYSLSAPTINIVIHYQLLLPLHIFHLLLLLIFLFIVILPPPLATKPGMNFVSIKQLHNHPTQQTLLYFSILNNRLCYSVHFF
jgi:hypothetical protein